MTENTSKLKVNKSTFRTYILAIMAAMTLTGCSFPLPGMNKASEASKDTIQIEKPTIVVNNGGKNYESQGDAMLKANGGVENSSETDDEYVEEQEYEEIYDDFNKIYSKKALDPNKIVIDFAGDVCFYDGFSLMSTYKDRGSNIENCIDMQLLDEMRGADIFMLNNEFCYSDRGTPIEGKTYAFRAKPEHVNILHDMGVDIVSLANNHAYDWGPDALADSVDVLNEARVPFVGAGKDIDEAMRPAYFTVNGVTVAFVSATQIERLGNPDTKEATETSPGVLRTLDPTKACKVIEKARENSDFVIMYVHWGSENTDLVEQSQRDLAKRYVESGADLIIGDHSHCLQGIDYIEDVPVFYSLGNYWFNSKTVDTGIARITLNTNAEIDEVRFIPAKQINFSTKWLGDSDESVRILNYLQGISNYAEIDTDTGVIVKSEINHNIQGGVNTSPTKKAPEVQEAPAEEENAEN